MRRISSAACAAILSLVLGIGLAPSAQAGSPAKSIKFPCKTTGTATLDPIVVPDGGPSAHEHLFAGNKGVPLGVHDYDQAISQATTCTFTGDTAAYWTPTLRTAAGALVPAKVVVYYDRMAQPITAFPPDFGMVWGFTRGQFSSKPRSFYGWNCDNNEPLQPNFANVDCRGMPSNNVVTFRGFAPYCWDGVNPGVRNYGDHVFYPTNYPTNQNCPAGATVLPRIRVNFNFQTQYCPDCVLSSDMQYGTTQGASAHTDFWNTWQQSALEGLVAQLNA